MNSAEPETEKLEASVDKGKMKGGRVDQDKSLCYACNICGKSFPFQSSLSQHMRKHTGERPYKCPYCEHRASQKGSLKLHIRSHKLGTLSHGHEEADGELGEAGVSEGLGACASPTESTSACNGVLHDNAKDDDGEKVNSKGTKKDKGTLRCLLCKRKLGSREELERHSQLHKPYRCRLCSFVAMREDQLLGHIEKTHITVEAAMPQVVEGVVGSGEQSEGHFPCKLCDKVFGQAWLLKAHTKKHLASVEHRCHVCGRRFREAWFLRSHMKTHGSRAGGRGKAKGDLELAATINNVVQDETSMFNGLCLFELCSRCGNLFHDQESLQVHKRVHSYAHRINGKRPHNRRKSDDDSDSPSAKKLFMEGLNLRPAAAQETPVEETLGKRIPELDPVCSYQAWQLATKGRVAEISDASRYLGWDEALEDADVAYDEEKGEYVAVGLEKCRQELGSNTSAIGQKRRGSGSARHQHRSSSGSSCQPSTACNGEVSPESVSDTEYSPPSRQSRRASQGKSSECFECGRVFRTHHQMVLHSRMHRKDARAGGESRGQGERLGSASEAESGSASCPSTPGYEDSPPSTVGEDTAGDAALDKKPYICNRCNVVTTDLSSWLSHVKNHHQESSVLKPNQVEPKCTEGKGTVSPSLVGADAADFPKLRKALLQELQQPLAPSSSKGGAAGSTAESQNGTRQRGKTDSAPLNLTVQCGNQPPGASIRLQGALVTHQCASCSFVTRYPEVLWIHQRVYHKANSSTQAARWTPKRRTGPPPALDGQECPPLPPMWVPRTRPPAPGSSKKSKSGESSSSSTSSHQGRDCGSAARAMPSGSPLHPAKKHKTSKHSTEEALQSQPRVELYPRVDRTATLEKGALGGPRRTSSPKGSSQLERFTLPREGLGFMLSSKHVLSEYARGTALSSPQPPHSAPSRPQNQQESHPLRHGSDLQAAWSRSSILLDPPPLMAQVKKELSTDTADPAGGILSFLKNCNSHGLSSLYQRWGAPPGATLDHAGMLRSLVRQGDYPCQECGKSFGQPSHLRTHMRSHTGERPFQCQHCPYSSSQKGNLKTHVQSVHRLAFDSGLQQGRSRPPSQPAEDPPDGSLQDRSVPETTVLD